MSRFLVLDIVFYGNSMNYDQGSGNYQELKKITKWDGKQYTLASRYALRYSILETARKTGLWEIADANSLHFAGEGENKVIQPSLKTLLSSSILEYPEFDLFGYLVTVTKPQNFRESPVKISHAVSMTPYFYDALFNANIGLANRMRKKYGEMSPNPFTSEEHQTFYQYSVVVDVDRIGKVESYLHSEVKSSNNNVIWKAELEEKEDKYKVEVKWKEGKGRAGNEFKENIEISKSAKIKIEENEFELKTTLDVIGNGKKIYVLRQEIEPHDNFVKTRIEQLLKAILNLKRSIKGREEDLSPKLVVVGVYNKHPYKTFKDKICLKDEYIEESYDEIIEEVEENKKVEKVKHIISKSKKPVFEISGLNKGGNNKSGEDGETQIVSEINETEILNFIEELFNNDAKLGKVKVFKDPSIEVGGP